MPGIPAIDCVGPAFNITKLRLFQPFRFSFWWRIAVLGILTGEISGGGGGGGSRFKAHAHGSTNGSEFLAPRIHDIAQWWPAILVAIVVLIILGILFLYVSSVLRFVLFEAVLRDRVRIREGWSRWNNKGLEYFLLKLAIFIPMLILAAVLLGGPLLAIVKAGGLPPAPVLLPGLIGGLLVLGSVGLVAAVFLVLTKDFVVPQMALQGVGWNQGWSTLWRIMKAEKGRFAVYVLLKILMAIAATVVLAFVIVLLVIAAAIPIGIFVVTGILLAKASAALGVVLAILGGLLLLFVVLPAFVFCVGFAGAPISVFFPAYSIVFFASRYRPLYDELYPPLPPQAEGQSPA